MCPLMKRKFQQKISLLAMIRFHWENSVNHENSMFTGTIAFVWKSTMDEKTVCHSNEETVKCNEPVLKVDVIDSRLGIQEGAVNL